MFPSQPIDCVTLRRRGACMLYINAVDVPELTFSFDGKRVQAHSNGLSVDLKMPKPEVNLEIKRMMEENPKSVYLSLAQNTGVQPGDISLRLSAVVA